MPSVNKSVLLPYSAQQMFDLVHEIDAYPQFLPWCSGAQVQSLADGNLRATLLIDYRGLRQSFTTFNRYEEPVHISMELVDGPFTRLNGQWRFRPLREDACKVEFELEYLFARGLLGQALAPVFGHIAGSMIDAFVQRAEAIHG